MRALSAIDIALWDIVGKSCGLPLYRCWAATGKRFRCSTAADITGGFRENLRHAGLSGTGYRQRAGPGIFLL